MTLAAVFVRKLPQRANRDELVFVSDSCLSGGQRFDQGLKIFTLPRSDSLFCFAGETYYAYPLAIHLSTTIASYQRSADRRYPLQKAVQHACRVFEQSYKLIHHHPSDGKPVDAPATFVFGGFSWHDNRFRIWKISIDREGRRFPLEEIQARHVFVGTAEALPDAEERLQKLLRDRGRASDTMDLEPFEVVRDIIKSKSYADIGGAPQIAKVFRHMNTQLFATVWPGADGALRPHVFGRPLLPYEQTSWPVFDPDELNFKSKGPWASATAAQPHAAADVRASAAECEG